MAPNKEIEITLSLKDEATKQIQSFRSSVREFSTATKSNLAPVLQLRQAWMKTTLAIGAVTGAFALGVEQMKVLNSEIETLDKSSAKLGTSTAELSKRIYGFNIASDESRIGVASVKQMQLEWQKLLMIIRTTAAESMGRSAIASRSNEIAQRGTKGFWGTMGNIALNNPLMGPVNMLLPNRNVSKYGDQAKQELLDLAQKQREIEALKNGTVAETINKTNQLEMSGYAFKLQLLKEETAAYKAAGVDKVTLANYEVSARKRLEEDYTLEVRNQQATILEAQGNTLDALRMKQENALATYKRQWGSDGEATREFIRGQKAMYRQAQYTYLGIKNNSQIIHDAYTSAISSMTSAMGSFYDTTTGEFKSLGEVATNFGRNMIGIIQEMIAQMVIAKAVAGISSIFSSSSTIVGGVGGTTTNTAQFGTVWSPTHMAEGGEGIVNKPTLFLAGEAGPERYQFNPLSKMNGAEHSPGGDTHIHIHNEQTFRFWDMADVYAHKEDINAIFTESARRQGSVIKSLKRYYPR